MRITLEVNKDAYWETDKVTLESAEDVKEVKNREWKGVNRLRLIRSIMRRTVKR